MKVTPDVTFSTDKAAGAASILGIVFKDCAICQHAEQFPGGNAVFVHFSMSMDCKFDLTVSYLIFYLPDYVFFI